MVKVSFSSPLAQKDAKKETLIPAEDTDVEAVLPVRQQSAVCYWCKYMALTLILVGMVIGGVLMCRSYLQRVNSHMSSEWTDRQMFCTMRYVPLEEDEVSSGTASSYYGGLYEVETPKPLWELEEGIQLLETEQVELIKVPVPEFNSGDPADIVHDFQLRLTAYLDLSLNKCYVTQLNSSIVMPPRDLLELLINIKAGMYLPQSYLVHEEMVVTERLERVDRLGSFIYNLCRGKDTFKLQRRDRILGMQKREAPNCHKIRHFASNFVVETQICEP